MKLHNTFPHQALGNAPPSHVINTAARWRRLQKQNKEVLEIVYIFLQIYDIPVDMIDVFIRQYLPVLACLGKSGVFALWSSLC